MVSPADADPMGGEPNGAPLPPRPEHAAGVRLADVAGALGAAVAPADGSRPARGAADGGAAEDPLITGITLDSRTVRRGDLYCALPGANVHGSRFASQAAAAGAAAALTDAGGRDACTAAGLPTFVVDDARASTATASALVWGEPSRALTMLGITGTNGKTSITTMLHRTLAELGRPTGVIGTSGTEIIAADGRTERIGTVRTTPEAPEVQGILARMLEEGVGTVSMEVSSHAMVLHRADAIAFDAVCFTNLTQDHLDFHADMEDYFAAKAALFTPEHARTAIVCVDDAWGRRLAEQTALPVVTYAASDAAEAVAAADVRATEIRPGAADDGVGTTFVLERRDGATGEVARHRLVSPLPGRHYVANTLAVALLLESIGLPIGETAPVIAHAASVPGRMELVVEEPVRGIVDYSHTEDALRQALATLRALPATRRLISVMGAGGDRDRRKRPLMGAAAAALADIVIVTDDNPRTEDPAAIRAAVLEGARAAGTGAEIHEADGRGRAIAQAAALARPGDVILVSGKGAETGQEVDGAVIPFDDRIQLRAAVRAAHPQEEL